MEAVLATATKDDSARTNAPASAPVVEWELFREICRTLPAALLVTDPAGRIELANDAAHALLGYPTATLMGRALRDVLDALDLADAIEFEFLRTGTAEARVERTMRDVAGEPIPVLFSASPMRGADGRVRRVACVALDIRARRRLEMELHRAQKLEAVGRLAAGIAHEINTPVQFVGDGLQFLQGAFQDVAALFDRTRALVQGAGSTGGGDLAAGLASIEAQADLPYLTEQIPRALDRCVDGLERIAGIVRAMREFSRPGGGRRALADINRALRNTLTVAHSQYRYVAEVETDFGELPPVFCEIGELNQVFLALVINAAQSIEVARAKGRLEMGRISLRTRAEDSVVEILVADTGDGIAPELRERIFEPFFTTRDVGRGPGLGLAVAHAIVVERHGGWLDFESEPGRGTTFHVRLPVDDGEAFTSVGGDR